MGINQTERIRDVFRRSKHLQQVIRYETKLRIIQERIHVVGNVREIEVLHWILEGKKYSWISTSYDFIRAPHPTLERLHRDANVGNAKYVEILFLENKEDKLKGKSGVG